MEAPTMFVERYTVVPAVDVEALRAALARESWRRGAEGGSFAVALGPSLLGTLDVDALPVGMHPFVDPDRRVRPLRDDVVLFTTSDDPQRAERLAPTLRFVARHEVPLVPTPVVLGGVVVLGTAEWPDEVRADVDVVGRVATAAGAVPFMLRRLVEGRENGVASLGADLYVALSRDRLAQVLARRDG